jgi:hypothetical protein
MLETEHISKLNQLYGLSDDEIKIVEEDVNESIKRGV